MSPTKEIAGATYYWNDDIGVNITRIKNNFIVHKKEKKITVNEDWIREGARDGLEIGFESFLDTRLVVLEGLKYIKEVPGVFVKKK